MSNIFLVRDKTIVYRGSGDAILILGGSGDTDEIILSSLIETLHGALMGVTHCPYALQETKILNSYPRVCLVLDGLATSGVPDTLDQLTLKRSTKWLD